jgi:Tol biopolymer transport system component
VFSQVALVKPDAVTAEKSTLHSFLETINLESMNRTVVYTAPERFEAPNWTRDGAALIFNRNGRIVSLKLEAGSSSEPTIIDTGFANRCNNDHLISPDGASLAISDSSQENHESLVYILPLAGGTPRRVTQRAPSYLHGWSPDGKTLAFVGQRNGNFDVYSISTAAGEETRLTTAEGLDDGPEYSPDGKYIYFNSERTGHMQIWRMHPDGSEQEQVTFDEFNNWFPHLSPDARQMVFLSYEKNVTGHPENKDVMLRIMSLSYENATSDKRMLDKKITILAKLFGGQGTINVPSWSPDGSQLAFVSYQLVSKESDSAPK